MRMLTRHSTTEPSSLVIARISLTHALFTFLSVLEAFFNPPLTASSMPLSDDAEISMTFATLFMTNLRLKGGRAGPPAMGGRVYALKRWRLVCGAANSAARSARTRAHRG